MMLALLYDSEPSYDYVSASQPDRWFFDNYASSCLFVERNNLPTPLLFFSGARFDAEKQKERISGVASFYKQATRNRVGFSGKTAIGAFAIANSFTMRRSGWKTVIPQKIRITIKIAIKITIRITIRIKMQGLARGLTPAN